MVKVDTSESHELSSVLKTQEQTIENIRCLFEDVDLESFSRSFKIMQVVCKYYDSYSFPLDSRMIEDCKFLGLQFDSEPNSHLNNIGLINNSK